MSDTGFPLFSKAVDDANRLLKDIERAEGWENHRNESYAALHSVLHTFRDRMTVDQAAHFASQLPLLVRGIFYDGWRPSKVPVKMNREGFIAAVRQEFPYKVHTSIEDLIVVVMQALVNATTEDIVDKTVSLLPTDLRELLRGEAVEIDLPVSRKIRRGGRIPPILPDEDA